MSTSLPLKPVLPRREWWAALVLILLTASLLRYTGYNFSLPYIDHVDEPSYNLAGRMIIDSGSAKPLGMQGYPPGIIMVNYVVLRLFHNPATPPSTVLWIVRLISVSFSVATVMILALVGYRIGPPVVGLLAAALWTFNPTGVEFSRYATADNFVTFFTLLAFFLALTGMRYDRVMWSRWGLVSCFLAIVFKYQAIFILPIILCLPLWRLTQKDIDKRRILREFAANVGVTAVFGFWLILLYPTLEATNSPDWSAPTEKLSIPTPDAIYRNFLTVYNAVADDITWVVGWFGLAVLIWRQFRQHVDLLGIACLVLGTLTWIVGISFYGYFGIQSFRQFISAGAFLTIIHSLGIVGLGFLLAEILRRIFVSPLRTYYVPISAVVIMAVLFFSQLPDIRASIANAHNHTLPDQRNELASWIDLSLPPGRFIANTENHKTLNSSWGGYAGIHNYIFDGIADIKNRPLSEWRARGVDYVITTLNEYNDMLAKPEYRTYIDGTLFVKGFPPSPEFRGPDIAVLRLTPIQNKLEETVGSVKLVGYDLDHTALRVGGNITFTLYWQITGKLDADYAVFNHLTTTDGLTLVAQIDGDPMPDVRRQTSTWDDPTETLISQPFTLQIAGNTPTGEYDLYTGFYRRSDGVRMVSTDGHDTMKVATITVIQ